MCCQPKRNPNVHHVKPEFTDLMASECSLLSVQALPWHESRYLLAVSFPRKISTGQFMLISDRTPHRHQVYFYCIFPLLEQNMNQTITLNHLPTHMSGWVLRSWGSLRILTVFPEPLPRQPAKITSIMALTHTNWRRLGTGVQLTAAGGPRWLGSGCWWPQDHYWTMFPVRCRRRRGVKASRLGDLCFHDFRLSVLGRKVIAIDKKDLYSF